MPGLYDMPEQQFKQLLDALERQTNLLAKLCQIQEAIFIMIADDREPEEQGQTYLSGKPKR